MFRIKPNKERKEKFAHILAGVIILLHAYEKYESQKSSYIIFLLAGIIFLSIALLHHRLVKYFPYTDSIFFVIEAVLYTVIAVDYFHEGKKGLPWCYLLATLAYLAVAIVKGKRGKAGFVKAAETKQEINPATPDE